MRYKRVMNPEGPGNVTKRADHGFIRTAEVHSSPEREWRLTVIGAVNRDKDAR